MDLTYEEMKEINDDLLELVRQGRVIVVDAEPEPLVVSAEMATPAHLANRMSVEAVEAYLTGVNRCAAAPMNQEGSRVARSGVRVLAVASIARHRSMS